MREAKGGKSIGGVCLLLAKNRRKFVKRFALADMKRTVAMCKSHPVDTRNGTFSEMR